MVDSGSTDSTLSIVERYADFVYSHPYRDHAQQLTWALQHAALSRDWVLWLDADFAVSEELRDQKTAVLSYPQEGRGGYFLNVYQAILDGSVRKTAVPLRQPAHADGR